MFPGITFQINFLLLNPFLSICFWNRISSLGLATVRKHRTGDKISEFHGNDLHQVCNKKDSIENNSNVGFKFHQIIYKFFLRPLMKFTLQCGESFGLKTLNY